MSKKKPSVASLLTLLKKAGVQPEVLPRFKDLDPMEHGMVFVLSEVLTSKQAEASVRALRAAWGDWNEVRVCQVQDLVTSIKSKSDDTSRAAARVVLDYLQDVFQNHHSFDLLDDGDDLANLGKHLVNFPVLGIAGAHYIQWLVGDEVMPVTSHLVRVFDRLGIMDRTTSYKKALEALSKLGAPKGKRALEFSLAFGRVADDWCDSRKPTCQDCALVSACGYGEKVKRDWIASQERLEAQRIRDEERERKAKEVEARKNEREAERHRKARKKAEKRGAAKKAAAEKAKGTAKKAAKKVTKKVTKKAAPKKAATKKVTKKVTKKAATKKVAKKAPAKKPAAKKATKKAVKKKAAKKKTTKKAAPKKATKKAAKKATKRR
ncbi:MAG: hypothetical protein P1V81_14350 [Planctomycetota bacterium]|nr:hypothetical protein [Planctomycetota bacterium]